MAVLYRDYRPQKFSELLGQEHVKQTLKNAVAKGSFGHAYLFTGPRGTGKTSAARIFARAINCLNPQDGEPCNKCEICRQFIDATSLDLNEIDAASNTGVENIREIIEHLKFSPTQAAYKVFIIDEVHMLSKGAFNALLKTLEEPPAHAVFILATTEIHKVPATVISRAQRFDFRRLEAGQLFEHLKKIAAKEKIKINDSVLQLIVRSAEGSGRDALSILDKIGSFGEVELSEVEQLLGITNIIASQKLFDFIVARDGAGALQYLEGIFIAGTDPVQFNRDFLEYLKDLLLASSGATFENSKYGDQSADFIRQSKALSQQQLLFVIRLFLRSYKDMESAPSAELPVEIAAAESCTEARHNVVAAQPAATAKVQNLAPEPTQMHVSEPEPPKKTVAKKQGIALSEEQLRGAWPQVLETIRNQHNSLYAALKKTTIQSVNENVITICTEYKFHQLSLENPKHNMMIIAAINEKTGADCALEIAIAQTVAEQQRGISSDLALEVFGGELV